MRTTVVRIGCNLCLRDSEHIGVDNFTQVGSYDYCRWCIPNFETGTIESGVHKVHVPGDGSWECSCGETYSGVFLTLRNNGISQAAMDNVPGNLDAALASLHVDTPFWPKAY